jgi:hypothetical protein
VGSSTEIAGNPGRGLYDKRVTVLIRRLEPRAPRGLIVTPPTLAIRGLAGVDRRAHRGRAMLIRLDGDGLAGTSDPQADVAVIEP